MRGRRLSQIPSDTVYVYVYASDGRSRCVCLSSLKGGRQLLLRSLRSNNGADFKQKQICRSADAPQCQLSSAAPTDTPRYRQNNPIVIRRSIQSRSAAPYSTAMVLRIPICPENYDMIYRTIDLRSAYTIVKENASALPEEDTDRKEQVMLEARQHRDMAVKAVRKGEINVVDWYISKLCTLAAQVNLR